METTAGDGRQVEPPASLSRRSKAPSSRAAIVASVGVTIVSAGALLYATGGYGIGMTQDSVTYVQGARHLAAGKGFVAEGTSVTWFAPGYSGLLSLGERFGLDAIRGARALAVVALCVTVALSYVLLRRHVYSQKVVVAGTIAVALSSVLLTIYREAMSEHVFIIVVLLFVIVGEEHVRSPGALWPLAALVALSWSAFYLRYAGIVFVGIAAVLVVAACWRRGAKPAVARGATVMAAGVCVPALWMKRNLDLGVPPLGARHPAATSLATNVSRTLEEFERWLTTDQISPSLRPILLVAAIAGVGATLVLSVRRSTKLRGEFREMLPLIIVVGLYVGYLIVAASVVAFAAIDFRFLSPIFVPSIIIAAWVVERAYRISTHRATRRLIVGAGLAWLAIAVFAFGQHVAASRAHGAGGYAAARWHNSKLIEDVRKLDPTALTVTNDPAAIELFTGRVVRPAPAERFFASSEQTSETLDRFVKLVQCRGPAKLVWFLNYSSDLYSIEELEQRLKLTPVSTERDGVIYDVEPTVVDPRPPCTPN